MRHPGAPQPWSASGADGLRVAVRLTPRASRDAIEGLVILADGRTVVAARVRAVPEGGRANAALVRLLAEALGVPPSRVALAEGATSRIKLLAVSGDASALAARLAARARAPTSISASVSGPCPPGPRRRSKH